MRQRGWWIGMREAIVALLTMVAMFVAVPPGALQAEMGCHSCHGTNSPSDIRPLDAAFRDPDSGGFQGNHRTHMGAVASPAVCSACHPGSSAYATSHRDGQIKLSANINSSPRGAVYHNQTSSFPQTPLPSLGSCADVNCHFENATPGWGSSSLVSPADCSTCHGVPPADGSHPSLAGSGRKHGDYYGTADSCARCHPDHAGEGKPFQHATSAGRRALAVVFGKAPNSGGSYSGNLSYPDYLPSQHPSRSGSCTNLYCHSSGDGGAANVTPVWGGTLPNDCTGCHGGDREAATMISTGKHQAHLNNDATLGLGNGFGCRACHAMTVGGSRQIISTRHVDGYKDYSGTRAGTIAAAGSGRCSINSCHSTGTKVNLFWNMSAANWYSERTMVCTGCHGTPILPDGRASAFVSVAGEPAYSNGGPLSGRANSHERHVAGAGVNDTSGCAACHNATVDGSVAGKLRNYSTLHLNGSRDVAFSAAATLGGVQGRYSSTTQQCINTSCHGSAASVHWGSTALACISCHSAEVNGFSASSAGSHAAHYESAIAPASGSYASMEPANIGTATEYRFTCTACHGAPASHGSGVADIASGAAAQVFFGVTSGGGRGNYSYAASGEPVTDRGFIWTRGECATVYCHSNGLPFDKGAVFRSVTWGGGAQSCTSCHDTGGEATGLSGRHGKHTSGAYGFTCERCHRDTAGNGSIGNKALHVNRVKDVAFREGGNYERGSRGCAGAYCHSDARGNAPRVAVKWSDMGVAMKCTSCHKGTTLDNGEAACAEIQGQWSSARMAGQSGYCTPSLTMSSNGHERLVGFRWIRNYPCSYCHNATVSDSGTIIDYSRHLDGTRDVVISPQWEIVGRSAPSYNSANKTCDNIYCHSDGTSNPDTVRVFGWSEGRTQCNTCHGHPRGSCSTSDPLTNTYCHDGRTDGTGKVWVLPKVYGNLTSYRWPPGQEWKAAIPMFRNQGGGTPRANSHARHAETTFTCDECHTATVPNGTCTDCHRDGIPPGKMGEVAHIDPRYHVNRTRDVVFKRGGSYDRVTKNCTNTACHTGGTDPVWGESVNSAVICLSCHGSTEGDTDDFGSFNDRKARISMTEWRVSGHGRPATAGPYPGSGNPAANFPGNPCWYCHDNTILHKDSSNPFRLRIHHQFEQRFEKECVYCHMEGREAECLGCHNNAESLAPQVSSAAVVARHEGSVKLAGCRDTQCHFSDEDIHDTKAGFWDALTKDDVRNQYLMMGVCLQCHDDDSGGKCATCHTAPPDNPYKYAIGFDPGTGRIKPQKARASSVHFGYKHYLASQVGGVAKGGKFCWDCHDPHGDANIYMVQNQVATSTKGRSGIPETRAAVAFTRKQSGLDYARISPPYDGICNVCHSAGSQHFRSDGGDGHNAGRVCTSCHEHRFTDSHAGGQGCGDCHANRPVPRHSAFGLPRDCTKCHAGAVAMRMDVMGQFKGNSHHVQGVEVNNRHCYACHWEATSQGLIDVTHHEGYNYRNHSSAKNAKVDLVVWGAGDRPAVYRLLSTAVQFTAARMGTTEERGETAKVTQHCVSCHSDRNNDTQPFGDCKVPRQYAWDFQSIDARYAQKGTATWGKSWGSKQIAKAFSAHGNAVNNGGGFDPATGLDGAIPNTRAGGENVQCFDCHNSHGSKVVGVTSSYVTFNGTRNGANLKETQAGKGGYAMSYKAAANTTAGAINPYSAGAGQCFDCHLTENAGTTPWGYRSTFGADKPIKGYTDSDRFGTSTPAYMERYGYKNKSQKGGHLKASSALKGTVKGTIDGLCTPCHDPHGVSRSLGDKQSYALPLLKGTWLTSPYREDVAAIPGTGSRDYPAMRVSTWGVSEDASTFGGLCLRCHEKGALTDGTPKNSAWKSVDRIHESVNGWGGTQHRYSCSKCHIPHNSGLPRLMMTNCLDGKHAGMVAAGGWPAGSGPKGSGQMPSCHPTGKPWPDNYWNTVTPW